MPAAPFHQALHALPIFLWIWRILRTPFVSPSVAPPTGGNDVLGGIAPLILASSEMLSRASKVLLQFGLEFCGREFRQCRLDHCQVAVETTALLDDRGLDTQFGYLVHLAAGVVLKLLPLPIAGQVGRRGIAPLGCAPGEPDAAGFALARTSNNLYRRVQSAQVPAVVRVRHADSTGNLAEVKCSNAHWTCVSTRSPWFARPSSPTTSYCRASNR